jgi:hypothetical protein
MTTRGAIERRYVSKDGKVKEYCYAMIKGIPYKEYRQLEHKRLYKSKSKRSAKLGVVEVERVHEMHSEGVGQQEIACRLGTTRYRVQVALGLR